MLFVFLSFVFCLFVWFWNVIVIFVLFVIENVFSFWSKVLASSKAKYWAPPCVYFAVIHWCPALCSLSFTIWHCRFTEYACYESENSEKWSTRFRLQTSQDNRMPLMLLLYSIRGTPFFSSENVDTAVPASRVISTVVLCYFLLLLQTNDNGITQSVHYSYNQSHLPTNAHNWFSNCT
jgi:hypothetical protein